ncbi:MAG: phoU [Phycisphaerales bacterium]|nr:phoU [Phycisphaerales bacterium]
MARNLHESLADLRTRLARMAASVQALVERAVESAFQGDAGMAQEAIRSDARVDADEVEVERLAIDLLALHQPAASDLRLVTTIIKVNSDFERIADCAVNVAQRVLPLARSGGYRPTPDLRLIGGTVVTTLRDTIKAFNLSDVDLARQVLRSDDVVDALYHQIVQDMLAATERDGSAASTNLSNIMIAKNLERIADHCTNVAEDVIYVHSGRIVRHLHAV